MDSSDVRSLNAQASAFTKRAPSGSFLIRAWGTPVLEAPIWELDGSPGTADAEEGAWPTSYESTTPVVRTLAATILAAHSVMLEDARELLDPQGCEGGGTVSRTTSMPLAFRRWQESAGVWRASAGAWAGAMVGRPRDAAGNGDDSRLAHPGSWRSVLEATSAAAKPQAGGATSSKGSKRGRAEQADEWSLSAAQRGFALVERAVMRAVDAWMEASGLPPAFAGVRRNAWPRIRWWTEVHGNCSRSQESDRLPGLAAGSVGLKMPARAASTMLLDPRLPQTPFEPEGPSVRMVEGGVLVHPAYLPRETLPTVGSDARVSLEFVVDAGEGEELQGGTRPTSERAELFPASTGSKPRRKGDASAETTADGRLTVDVDSDVAEGAYGEEREPVLAVGMARQGGAAVSEAHGSGSGVRNGDVLSVTSVVPRRWLPRLQPVDTLASLEPVGRLRDAWEWEEEEEEEVEELVEEEEQEEEAGAETAHVEPRTNLGEAGSDAAAGTGREDDEDDAPGLEGAEDYSEEDWGESEDEW
ncbi:hypothetical protein FNF28_02582 [Cafeteria roenbergensis]|uniref:Uncharacterized protein n=1 Tax=Cafeteria roenbergensis TaxID=33653 RepID=A0A5A8DRY0_CAFRO|nr:hypothetical protein FNF28_02582 [Cafeteria roenbergensis]